MRKTFIITFIGLLGVFLFYKQCRVDPQNRDHLKRTTTICDGLFVETYSIFGQGAFGSDLVADWLTDQKNFRVFIGTEDEGQSDGWRYECKGDTIVAQNKTEYKTFKISDLSKMDNFE